MRKIQLAVISMVAVLGMGLVFASTAQAIDPFEPCAGNTESSVCAGKDDKASTLINTIVNTMIFIVGLLSVISIIASGIMYATSNGESANITKAKNTLTYAIVGLVVALVAYALVNWVISALPK